MTGSKTRSALAPIIGRRAAIAGAGSLLAFPAIHASAQTSGVALVIGNSKYQWEASLPNVKRDAPDIARRFEGLGLKTELLMDVGQADMKRGVDKFLQAVRGAEFAAFYFAGHGAQWGRDTYLVPVDADLSSPNAVGTLVPGGIVRDGIGGARHSLIALDNCRNNPADGWRQREAMDSAKGNDEGAAGGSSTGRPPPPNMLMLFSTAPGRVALDGPPGDNSPFAAALLRQLDGASVEFQGMATRLRRDLLIATSGRQVLWDRDTYAGPFRLAGRAGGRRGATGGWAGDPSRIIELSNTYAFAQQNGLPLPPGLIAHRPPSGSRDNMKVGSFSYTGAERNPSLFIVMSVEEQQTAELIIATQVAGQVAWRFVQGQIAGETIDVTPRDGGGRHVIDWKSVNGGNLTIFPRAQVQRSVIPTGRAFTRLDG